MSDLTPLVAIEHTALMAVWNAFNCTDSMLCPRFDVGQPCPAVQQSTLYETDRLLCTNGSVRALTMDKRNMIRFGSISPAIGLLSMLTEIIVTDQYGGLSGTIPTEIGLLSRLTTLALCCNNISGTIPTQIGRIDGLKNFALQQNQLSGTIPLEIASLTSVTFVKLYGNRLSGSVPIFRGVNVTQSSLACQITKTSDESNCFVLCLEPACCDIGPCVGNNVTHSTRLVVTPAGVSVRTTSSSTSTTSSSSTLTLTSSLSVLSTNATTTPPTTTQEFLFSSVARSAPADNGGVTVLIIVMVGILLLLVAVITAIVCVVRRRRRRKTTGANVVPAAAQTDTPAPAKNSFEMVSAVSSNYSTVPQNPYDVGNLNLAT
jgi:hypothetical protein